MNRAGPVSHRSSRPVFLDQSGRRRRLVVLSGVALGAVLLVGLVILLAGFSGASGLHVPGFPDVNPANGAAVVPTDDPATDPTDDPASLEGGIPGDGTSATPTRTTPRRVPTQTPSHQPKPTKT